MIAQARSTSPLPIDRSAAAIARDALTRIPSAHFRDMAWAKDAIATSLAMVAEVLDGDGVRAVEWVREISASPEAVSRMCVLSAVCDAIVADTFRTKGDVRSVTGTVSTFEHEAYAVFAAQRDQRDFDAMNDSDTAELAAGLVRVVQMHDKETAIHLDATAALARRIAVAMELPPEQIVTIELAARLHDIGKVGVRKDILCKSGALTAQEWQEMRLHAEVGASVLLDTPKLAHLAPIVRAHHERIDGYGYPDRLRATEIPLEARVIAVADAFHAMTTERSYRRAMMPNEALEVLAEDAGTQFDVDVVEATFELFRYVRRSRRAIA